MKPTVVLITGGWHVPESYSDLLGRLEADGFPTRCEKIPSIGSTKPADDTVASDAFFFRDQVILPELKTNNVILLMHSYGGALGGAAAKGLGPGDRGSGSTAVIGLIFMAAFLCQSDKSFTEDLSNILNLADVDETGHIMTLKDPKSTLYADIKDPAVMDRAVELLQPQSTAPLYSISPPQAYFDHDFHGRRLYIMCGADKTMPLEVVNLMLEATGLEWQKELLEDSGHSPFLTHQGELVRIINRYSEQWQKT